MRATRTIWALTLSVMLFGGCLAILAQDKGDMADTDSRIARLSKELNLTADQQTKLRPIFEHQSDDWKAVIGDQSLTKEQKRAKMKEIHEKYAPKVDSVLTPEQQTKMKAMREEAYQNKHENMDKH